MAKDIVWIIVALIAIGVMTGYIKISGIGPAEPGVTTVPPSGGFGQLVSLSVKGVDKLRGTAFGANAESWSDDGNQMVPETSIPSALTALGTSYPNTFSGYVMLGNDNYASTTDRGDDYYYVKYLVSWSGIQGLTTRDNIQTYAEETTTGTSLWTFYDDNTAESTANITIGSGGTYTASSVKLMSSSRNCTGNPSLNGYNGKKAIGFCFNESTSGQFKEIKPQKNSGTFTAPGWLSGKNVVGCYYVTDAVCDGDYFVTDLYFEANSGQDPASTDSVHVIPVDLCYYKDDNLKWQVGFGDESELSADTDCGINSIAAALTINMM